MGVPRSVLEFKNAMETRVDDTAVISYYALRTWIGVVGVSLPTVLLLLTTSREHIDPTISDFYYGNMRDWFVGSLCAIGIFLGCYRGDFRIEKWLGRLGCLFAIGVAFNPTAGHPPVAAPSVWQRIYGGFGLAGPPEKLHYASAACLFVVLALFCLWPFRLIPRDGKTPGKETRNKWYAFFGTAILLSLVTVGLGTRFIGESWDRRSLTFWFEAIMVWSFGFSWLLKGKYFEEKVLFPFRDAPGKLRRRFRAVRLSTG